MECSEYASEGPRRERGVRERFPSDLTRWLRRRNKERIGRRTGEPVGFGDPDFYDGDGKGGRGDVEQPGPERSHEGDPTGLA